MVFYGNSEHRFNFFVTKNLILVEFFKNSNILPCFTHIAL